MYKRKTLRDAYKEYLRLNLPKTSNYVDYKVYKEVCTDFNQLVHDEILNKGMGFKMPSGLGVIQILKTKTKGDIYNYNYYKKHGKKVKEFNRHTFGYRCKYVWSKNDYPFTNKHIFKFVPTRTNKRTLAKLLKETMLIVTSIQERIKNPRQK